MLLIVSQEGTFVTESGAFVIYPGEWINGNETLSHVVRLLNTSVEFTADFVFPGEQEKSTDFLICRRKTLRSS